MNNRSIKKGWAAGLTILLFSIAIAPLSQAILIEESNRPISKGDTLYVGGTGLGNYTKIQDAIDNSSNGDTVFVYAYSSPYYENIIVDKSINLIGENRDTTVIFSLNNGSVVSISADQVDMSGFSIESYENVTFSSGLSISSNHSTISGNTIRSNRGYGIYLWGDNNVLNNNLIESNFMIGIGLEGDSNTISGNTISNQGAGIVLINSNVNTINGNNISSHAYGIVLNGSASNIISSNNLTFNILNGIILYDSNENTFIYNTIKNSNCGIELSSSKKNLIQKNNFLRNSRNAYFENCRNKWKNNYWNRPRLLPKPIRGAVCINIPFPFQDIVLRWFNFDLRPALKPYDI